RGGRLSRAKVSKCAAIAVAPRATNSIHFRESGNPRFRVPGERSETRDPEPPPVAPRCPVLRKRTGGSFAVPASKLRTLLLRRQCRPSDTILQQLASDP